MSAIGQRFETSLRYGCLHCATSPAEVPTSFCVVSFWGDDPPSTIPISLGILVGVVKGYHYLGSLKTRLFSKVMKQVNMEISGKILSRIGAKQQNNTFLETTYWGLIQNCKYQKLVGNIDMGPE